MCIIFITIKFSAVKNKRLYGANKVSLSFIFYYSVDTLLSSPSSLKKKERQRTLSFTTSLKTKICIFIYIFVIPFRTKAPRACSSSCWASMNISAFFGDGPNVLGRKRAIFPLSLEKNP